MNWSYWIIRLQLESEMMKSQHNNTYRRKALETLNFAFECWTIFWGYIWIFLEPCAGNPCQNGGTCSLSGKDFTCACVSGFTGNMCENGTLMNNN